ncbi:MAG: dihydrolipoamide acetyltransferase family protein [Anaerolineae bacterium]
MATKILMPQLGESVVEGTVSRWRVQVGDQVKQYDVLLEVSTDKVDTEIPSPVAGTVLSIVAADGETVKAGSLIALIGQPGEDIGASAAPAPQAADRAATSADGAPPCVFSENASAAAALDESRRLSPVVAKMATEHGIDIAQVPGTGLGGRVTKKDVLTYLERRDLAGPAPVLPTLMPWEMPGSGDLFKPAAPWSAPAASATASERPAPMPPAAAAPVASRPPAAVSRAGMADEEIMPLSAMRRSIARHMVASKFTAPHVTTVFEADLSQVVAHRNAVKADYERLGVKLTFTPYFVQAVVAALKAHPQVNASFSEEALILKKRVHIGVAVDIGDGLLVPVVKDADDLTLKGLARTIADLAERARTRKLAPDELAGSTFTITNHGVSGSLFAMPIINQPNVGILGVGAIQKRVVVVGDAIAIRPMCYLSFTFDHRALDGALADHFAAAVVKHLENWRRE